MEPSCEPISEEWSSLSGMYISEEAEFMSQLLGNCSVTQQFCGNFNLGIPSAFWPGHESTIVSVPGINDSSYFPANVADTTLLCFLHGSSFSDLKTDEELGLVDPGKMVIEDKNLQVQKESEVLVSEPEEEDINSNMENSRKRSRSSIKIPKNKRNVKSMKKPKYASISNAEEDISLGLQGSCCSEDDSNASQEFHGGGSSSMSPKDSKVLKLNGRSRSNRGSATDPQSVYARRRRERINERLRILKNLVPNGTKVDVSTMLEEAVQYVKFLQLQIKLLSSDDLWMYAPIAYNGMNIGLDLNNVTPTKQP